MKAVFKNKKILSFSVFSLAIILSFIIIIPKVLALNDGSGKIVKKQNDKTSSQEIILSEISDDVVIETNDDNSPKVQEINNNQSKDTPKTDNSNISTENSVEVPKIIIDNEQDNSDNDSFIKMSSDIIEMSNIKFKFNSLEEDDFLFHKATKTYLSDSLDMIVLDAKNNTIYKIYLMPESVTKNSIKAKSKSDADLKAMADKLASKFCKDIGRYNTYRVQCEKALNTYSVVYTRTINGYNTTEHMSVTFDSNLNFLSYFCMPNVFDEIDVSNLDIDEKAITEQVNNAALAKRGESFGHNKIIAMTLTVKNSKLIMSVEYIEYNKDGKPLVQNAIAITEIEIK